MDAMQSAGPSQTRPSWLRPKTLLLLTAITLAGSALMSMAVDITLYLTWGPTLQGSAGEDVTDTPMARAFMFWRACLVGLLVLAAMCAWSRHRGRRVYRYRDAVARSGLTTLGLVVLGVLFVVEGTVFSLSLEATLLVLFLSGFAVMLNALNVFLVAPAIIDAWYSVLDHEHPQETRDGARKRRLWLGALLLCLCVAPFIGIMAWG